MPSGYSEHHHGFAGTITLTPSTFADVVVAVAESVAPHGRRRLLLVNAHGDNDEPVTLATDRIQREFDLPVHTASREDVVRRLAQHFGDDWVHAGPDETSVMELRHPNFLREERKQPQTRHEIANTRQYACFRRVHRGGRSGRPNRRRSRIRRGGHRRGYRAIPGNARRRATGTASRSRARRPRR